DPRVGRDTLLGALFGSVSAVLTHATNALPAWIPILGQTPVPPNSRLLEGLPHTVAALLSRSQFSLLIALSMFFGLFLLRLVFRRGISGLVILGVLIALTNLGGENVLLETPFAFAQGILMAWTIGRYGLLAAVMFMFFRISLSMVTLPLDSAAPYMFS